MNSPFWQVLPRAILLAVVIWGGSSFGCFAAGTWLIPAAMAIAHGSWSTLGEINREGYVFAEVPPWVDPHSEVYLIINCGTGILGVVGGGLGLVGGIRYWRYLVVKKLRWMTEDQVDEYLTRAAQRG